MGGICTYSNDAKNKLLNVSPRDLNKFGAVSEQVAKSMLEGALNAFNANCGISVTGIAGPGGGSTQKPVGMICCAIAAWDKIFTKTFYLKGDRNENQLEITALTLESLVTLIESQTKQRENLIEG